MSDTTDPLHLLPSEVVLRILDFISPASLASLTRLNRSWHSFIEDDHREAIYAPKTEHPLGAKDFRFVEDTESFAKYYAEVTSWRELCKRQILLSRNWESSHPVTRESTFQIGNDPIWRFKPDFKRRLILSTSQAGGLTVTDMDNGERLFYLPREIVRPFAHLEYQDGTAVFDREGNAVEVWRIDDASETRGLLEMITVLPHEKLTRGFQLSFDTLCVVSSDGLGFVYENMTRGQPQLKTMMTIEEGATGHLHQCADAVAWSQGPNGYQLYDKTSGKFLGTLHPPFCDRDNYFHIEHIVERGTSDGSLDTAIGATNGITCSPRHARKDRTSPIHIEDGPMPLTDGEFIPMPEDEWGAGMFDGDLFVGVSRGGRVFVCSNWRKALQNVASFAANTYIVECDSDGSTFDLGGWLSVRNRRIMFEIQDRIYVIGLDDQNRVICVVPSRPSFTIASCLSPQLAVPVSFMALYDDCIMTTYTTLRHRDRSIFQLAQNRRGVLPTKLIRVLSLAPSMNREEDDVEDVEGRASQSYNILGHDMSQFVQMLADEAEDDEGDVEAAMDLLGQDGEYEDLDELD